MSSKLSNVADANFPRDPEGRVYHLSVKTGEVANRILSVGELSRAKVIAGLLDDPDHLFVVSNRGFTVFTGTFKKVPVSVIATGMGLAMMDFVVRECRAVVEGPMVVIRFGTCGTPQPSVPVGAIVVADSSILIRRNPDHWAPCPDGATPPNPYDFSKALASDAKLSQLLFENMCAAVGPIVVRGVNATGDSFYSSQGRFDPNFIDDNASLLDELVGRHPDITSLEMETFQLYNLARCSVNNNLHTSAATIVLAQRCSNAFLDNDTKQVLEKGGGKACLSTLIAFHIDPKELMNSPDCVWNKSAN